MFLGDFAKPVISLQFFTELANSKELILMRGDIHTKQLTPSHAQTLINQIQIFYLNDEVTKVFFFLLLINFTYFYYYSIIII